jgi:hypothetical protein
MSHLILGECEIPFGRLRARISHHAIVGLICRAPYWSAFVPHFRTATFMSHSILECFRTTLSYRDIYVAPHIGVLSYHTFVPRHLCRTPYLTGTHKCEIPFGRLRARISHYAIVGLICQSATCRASYFGCLRRRRDTLRQAQGENLALRHCRINLSICNMSRLIFWMPAPKAR